MRILEFMSFNPGWFLTVPGILITAGVILLLIALILLLTSGKKEETKVEEVSVPVNPVTETPSVEPVKVDVPQMPEANLEQTVSAPVVEQPVSAAPTVEISSIPTVEPAQEIKEESKIEIFEPVAPAQPVVPTVNIETPVSNAVSTDNVEASVSNIIPAVEEVKVEQPEAKPAVSIYGGVSPTADIFKQPEQPKVIYGGADPLENTAPIPKVETVPVVQTIAEPTQIIEPVSNEVPVTQTAVMDNSVTETISATPVFPTMPEVSQSSPLFETPVAPVAEPVAPVAPVTPKEEIETLDF